ncbi:MAG: hypothetical protein RQ724_08515 [Desulfuromonadales bacterium]|nr:hypothetical protein [Desulfuromonadales bacterium]
MKEEKNLIEVIMVDGTKCRMAPKALNLFLSVNRILKFKRADGWATVGVDTLRENLPQPEPRKPERRASFASFFTETAMLPC